MSPPLDALSVFSVESPVLVRFLPCRSEGVASPDHRFYLDHHRDFSVYDFMQSRGYSGFTGGVRDVDLYQDPPGGE